MDVPQITKSKLRKELLSMYFINSEKEYYLRELERMLNFSVGNIRRELLKLEMVGLFDSRRRGNLTYYFLNKKYPLYNELKSIISKTIGIKEILKSALEGIKGIKISFIYGSFARDEQKQGSDIDILVIGRVDEKIFTRMVVFIERQCQREINCSLYDESDFNKKKKEKNPFILEVLKQPKIFLIGDENDL